jgi:hypothetical protein
MAISSTDTNDSAPLRRLRTRLARWRRDHGGRGRRIPEELWIEAACLAGSEGEARVARALRLSPKGLALRVTALEESDGPAASFVELLPAQLGPVLGAEPGRSTVLAVGPGGEKLQLELTPSCGAASGEVVAAFFKAVGRR